MPIGLQFDQPPVIGQRSVVTVTVLPGDQAPGIIQFVSTEVSGKKALSPCWQFYLQYYIYLVRISGFSSSN